MYTVQETLVLGDKMWQMISIQFIIILEDKMKPNDWFLGYLTMLLNCTSLYHQMVWYDKHEQLIGKDWEEVVMSYFMVL